MKLTGNRARYLSLNDAIASSFLSPNTLENLSVTASERLLEDGSKIERKKAHGCSD